MKAKLAVLDHPGQLMTAGAVIEARAIQTHFQALVDYSSSRILGFEALARGPADSPLYAPDALFASAQREGCLPELDELCITSAYRRFKAQALPGKLFLNILPENLPDIPDLLLPLSDDASLSGIVIEISEKYPLKDFDYLRQHIEVVRNKGAIIAVDDLGAGYSGLKTWAELQPNFVKIDRHFIQDVHSNVVKREFVRSITEISRSLKCQVIAEGIETEEELETLLSLGIRFGQGYLVHKPEGTPDPATLLRPLNVSRTIAQQALYLRPSETVGSILETVEPLTPNIRADIVKDFFRDNPGIRSIPLVEEGMARGIISRYRILEVFSNRFAHELHGKKPISRFMEAKPVVADEQESLQNVSKAITESNRVDLNADFIITRKGKYAGVGRISVLLQEVTDLQVRYARHSNPLTLLPGNVHIYEWVDNLLEEDEPFHIAYFDINNFKPYNDYFGYSHGDEVITRLGNILVSNTSANLDRVGHVGGDDFVAIFRSDDWREKCENILADFAAILPRIYTQKELDQQGIWCEDRQGEPAFFSLLSLAIGVVCPDPKRCGSHHDVASLASDAKHQAKVHGGNHLFVCRRRAIDTAKVEQRTKRSEESPLERLNSTSAHSTSQ